jgi:acyl carrier protein
MNDELNRVTAIVCQLGKIPSVGPDDDLYDAGFSSINALQLLMDLEDAFEVSIPDDQFIEARTPRALSQMIADVKEVSA